MSWEVHTRASQVSTKFFLHLNWTGWVGVWWEEGVRGVTTHNLEKWSRMKQVIIILLAFPKQII